MGVFVAGWMGLISLVLRLLQPAMSLALLVLSPLTQASPARAKHKLQKLVRVAAEQRPGQHQPVVLVFGKAKLAAQRNQVVAQQLCQRVA